jgi:aldehyde dehydrogenase
MDADDEFFDKALEGLALFAYDKGEVRTCPSRALVQESIFEKYKPCEAAPRTIPVSHRIK